MRRTPLKRPKRALAKSKRKIRGISPLKKKLDTLFSLYIRQKYDKTCYTCGGGGKVLQCGHFVSRMYLATRWDENNARPQCRMCNCLMNGRAVDFEERLIEEIGQEAVNILKRKRKEITKLTPEWYEAEIKLLTEKLATLSTTTT